MIMFQLAEVKMMKVIMIILVIRGVLNHLTNEQN